MAIQDAAPVRLNTRPAALTFLYHPTVRAIAFQTILAVAIVVFVIWIADNTIDNLRRANIASGFGFLSNRAGFDISQTLVSYSSDSTYGRALLVGFLNTLLVAAIGIVLASILGFLVGIARLSKNWLLAKVATVYVEIFRNIPLLLQLLFWYKAVLSVLPSPRQGVELPFGANLSNRGLIVPRPLVGDTLYLTGLAILIGIAVTVWVAIWAHRRQMATGQQFPTLRLGLAAIVGLPLVIFIVTGAPLGFEIPALQGFNFVGGVQIKPEFLALILGISLYTATFISEIVRAGILAVSHGQTEASYSLGLRATPTLRLVVIPQAMRIIIPPLTSQYLNLTKNSSLAVAIGYPDLVAVFSGTVLNQTGQAVEVIFITMLIYLSLSLVTALFMNWFNKRVALVER